MSSQQEGRYSAAIVGQAVTLTPVTGSESKPVFLAASTIVFNTVASTPPAEMWDAKYHYLVTVQRVTKTIP